ncbi:MAG TPA: type II toxin-antitoxin system VapC family toxin [Bacteroidales bacterium]|nr:type II toxin-antitoxin system VapC family toxin [Bacteroidales bacterium]
MRFWDSSALIPLCLTESSSEDVKRLVRSDEDIVVWWATRVECLSALARRRREGTLSSDADIKSKAVLSVMAAEWSEVLPSERIRQRAERLLLTHPLRAADAFQLAAALIWAEEAPQGLEVVCLDQNLREAALKEGFTLLP